MKGMSWVLMTYNGLCPTAVYWLFKGIMIVNGHALHFRPWPPLGPIGSFIFYVPDVADRRSYVIVRTMSPRYRNQLQATLTQNSTWLMVIAFCEMPPPLFIFLPAFYKERLKYFTWSICGNGRHHTKRMTHSALCPKWLNYADDMLRFIGLFGRGDCGRAWPDLERIKRLLCVWGWTGENI